MNKGERSNLLSDDQMASFIISGYHIVEPDLAPGYNEEICCSLRAMPENPGENIVEALPAITVLLEHPAVVGVLTSLLGPDYVRDPGGHIHMNPPQTRAQPWHQDERFGRGHQDRDVDHIKHLMLMFYPQDVTEDMTHRAAPGQPKARRRSRDNGHARQFARTGIFNCHGGLGPPDPFRHLACRDGQPK